MSDLKKLSKEKLEAKIKSLEGINDKFDGKNKLVLKQLEQHKAELESRDKDSKKVKEAVKKAESKKEDKKDEKKEVEKDSKKKDSKTQSFKFFVREMTEDGEIIKDDIIEIYSNSGVSEAIKGAKELAEEAKKEASNIIEISEKAFSKEEKKPAARKTPAKKAPAKKAPAKKAPAKKEEKKEVFKLVVDGKEYIFNDEASKNECEKALKVVKEKAKEEAEHKAAREKGREEAKKIPVTTKVVDSFATITKRIVGEAKKNDDNKSMDEVKKAVSEVEKAFGNLFDKLEMLMGKKIPQGQRKEIMTILEGYKDDAQEEKDKIEEKKAKAKTKRRVVKKEDGGFVETGGSDEWSYLSFLK
jgi:X-linked retinitis pigmentosa GTPase regulator